MTKSGDVTKPNCDAAPPLRFGACHHRSAIYFRTQARCTSRTLPSYLAAIGLPAAPLPPPASSAAAARFAQTKTPRSLGDILEYWGPSV